MVFPVLIVYLYLKLIDSGKHSQKVVFAVLIGLCGAVGMLIKFTVLIALIAVGIHCVLFRGVVPFLKSIAVVGVIIAAVFMAFNCYFYTVHLDREKAYELKIPYVHWVMMSMGDGSYNPADYDFTLSFPDKKEQRAIILTSIKERMIEKGLFGTLRLVYWKGIVTFSDGTYAQSFFLDDNPVGDKDLCDIILYDGRYFNRYKYICNGTYLALQLLMLVSAFGVLFQKEKAHSSMIPLLCVFGISLFLMCWEVSGRHIISFIPMMMIASVSGFTVIERALNKLSLHKVMGTWESVITNSSLDSPNTHEL